MTNQTTNKNANETLERASVATSSAPQPAGAAPPPYPYPHIYPGAKPTKGARAKDVLQTISMSIPIIGAVGTLFVWLAANLYVGDVEVITNRPNPDMMVNVFNQKGQETSYRVNKFQLMPGQYRIEICPDSKTKIVSDLNVQFHTTNRILIGASSKGTVTRQAPLVMNSSGEEIPAEPQTSALSPIATPEPAAVTQEPVRQGEQEDMPVVVNDHEQNAAGQAKSPSNNAVPGTGATDRGAATHAVSANADAMRNDKPGGNETAPAPESPKTKASVGNGGVESEHHKWWQLRHKKSEQ